MVAKVAVHCHCHVVADAEHGAKGVGAQAHVSMLAHIFKRLAFLLHGVVVGASAVELNALALNFHALSGALTFHEFSYCAKASTGGDVFEQRFFNGGGVHHDLHIFNGGAIVECDELHLLVAAARTHPSLHAHISADECGVEDVHYFCSFYFHCMLGVGKKNALV